MLPNQFIESLWYWQTFQCTNSPSTGEVPQTVLLVGYDLWLHLKSAKRYFDEAIYVVYFPKYISYEISEISAHFKILPLKQKTNANIADIVPSYFFSHFQNDSKSKSFQSNIALLVTFQKYTFLKNGDYNHHWGMQMVQASHEICFLDNFAKNIEQNIL